MPLLGKCSATSPLFFPFHLTFERRPYLAQAGLELNYGAEDSLETPSFCLCLPGAGHACVPHLIQLRNSFSNTLWRNWHGGPTVSQTGSLVLVRNARVKSFRQFCGRAGSRSEAMMRLGKQVPEDQSRESLHLGGSCGSENRVGAT